MLHTLTKTFFCLCLPVSVFSQIQWQTTHGNANQGACRLVASSIKATVYPAYLDVEEEAEIATLGNTWGSGDPKSLEIYGRFNLSPGSAIISMLLWNGDLILKARLKGKAEANKQYEEVVDRNIIPPPAPRDPALIEYEGADRYRIKIYPAVLGKTRKIRLRYIVPVTMAPGTIATNLTTVFAPAIPDNTGKIQLKLVHGGGQGNFLMVLDGRPKTITFPSTHLIHPGAKVAIYLGRPVPALATMTQFADGDYKGHYLGVYAHVPNEIIKWPGFNPTSGFSVGVTISNTRNSYSFDLACQDYGAGFQCAPLLFNGKSQNPWSSEVVWRLYNSSGREMLKYTQDCKLEQHQADSALAVIWAASAFPFAEDKENYLGLRYGFVDAWVSLLALEEDTLGRIAQKAWEYEGVPRLTAQDKFPPDTNAVFFAFDPKNNANPGDWNFPSTSSLQDIQGAGTGTFQTRLLPINGQVIRLKIPDVLASPFEKNRLRFTLYRLDGTKVISVDLENWESLEIRLRNLKVKDGTYLAMLEGKGLRYSQRITLR